MIPHTTRAHDEEWLRQGTVMSGSLQGPYTKTIATDMHFDGTQN